VCPCSRCAYTSPSVADIERSEIRAEKLAELESTPPAMTNTFAQLVLRTDWRGQYALRAPFTGYCLSYDGRYCLSCLGQKSR